MDYKEIEKPNNELNSIIADCDKRSKSNRDRKAKKKLFRSISLKITNIQLSSILHLIKK